MIIHRRFRGVGAIAVAALLNAGVALVTQVPVAQADYATCPTNYRAGGFAANRQHNGTTDSVYGVKAVINPTVSTFGPCGPYDVDASGSSAWVAVIPSPGNAYASTPGAVLQIGIARCYDPGNDACWPTDIPNHYPPQANFVLFWTYGGCGEAPIFGQFLGVVNDNQHTHEIRHVSSGGSRYSLYFDDDYTEVTKYTTDPYVSCWISGRHGAMYGTEAWLDGDGIADANAKVIFSDVGWRITDSGAWQDPTWDGTADCSQHDARPSLWYRCDRSNVIQDQFYAWSEA